MVIVRLLCGVFWFLLALPFLCLVGLFVSPKKEYNTESRFHRVLLNSTTAWAFFALGVTVKFEGEERLPQGSFLLVSNHRSNYDPIVTWYALRHRPVVFVSKPENFSILGYGRLIHRLGFLPIHRTSPKAAIRTVYRAADRLKAHEGLVVGVYPEGTRSRIGKMLPFHDGVFAIAKKAEVPFVVVSVEGTEQIYRNVPFHKTEVLLKVLRVVDKDEHASLRTADCAALAREQLLSALGS